MRIQKEDSHRVVESQNLYMNIASIEYMNIESINEYKHHFIQHHFVIK